jgi:hypothetical protein
LPSTTPAPSTSTSTCADLRCEGRPTGNREKSLRLTVAMGEAGPIDIPRVKPARRWRAVWTSPGSPASGHPVGRARTNTHNQPQLDVTHTPCVTTSFGRLTGSATRPGRIPNTCAAGSNPAGGTERRCRSGGRNVYVLRPEALVETAAVPEGLADMDMEAAGIGMDTDIDAPPSKRSTKVPRRKSARDGRTARASRRRGR